MIGKSIKNVCSQGISRWKYIVKRERNFEDHSEYRKLGKVVSPSTKDSPAKTASSNKLPDWEDDSSSHIPLNAKKHFLFIYIYIYIYILLHNCGSINICYLLMERFLLCAANLQATSSNRPLWPSLEVPAVDLSNTAWEQKKVLIKQLAGNACSNHGSKATSSTESSVRLL